MTDDIKAKRESMIIALESEVRHFYDALFRLGVGAEFHAFVEWCGVMKEHLNICRDLIEQGIDPFTLNKHTGMELPIPSYRLDYMAEKIDCIFAGALRVAKEGQNECT